MFELVIRSRQKRLAAGLQDTETEIDRLQSALATISINGGKNWR